MLSTRSGALAGPDVGSVDVGIFGPPPPGQLVDHLQSILRGLGFPLETQQVEERLLSSKLLALREAGPLGPAADCEVGVGRPQSWATHAQHLIL